MPSTFIAGYDGSDGAREAVRFAVRLAGALGADVHAVTGYAVPRHNFGKGASDGAEAALADDSRAEADLMLADLDEAGLSARSVRPGEPAQALIEAADDADADLIVVGTHEAEGLQRLKLGSTAERVVHGAPCAVSIVPAGSSPGELATVAVAYDGREAAQTALQYGVALAQALKARLVLIAAVEPGTRYEVGQDDERYHAAVTDETDAAAKALPAELDVEVRIVSGDAGEAIVASCEDNVDVLVAGSRAYGPLRATLVGAVSHHLARHATCPVIVVPRQMAQIPAVASGAPVSDGA